MFWNFCVPLDDVRITKESEANNRKPEMIKQIAEALGVSPLAIADPVISSNIATMYALFELEHKYQMKIEKLEPHDDDELGVVVRMGLTVEFTNNMYSYLQDWYKAYAEMQAFLWKWFFGSWI